MLYEHFNHNQLRRYLVAFGSFFSGMELVRTDATGIETQRMIVPLDYGPKEKWFYRITQDPDLTKGIGVALPRMTYHVSAIGYDASRKINTLNQFKFPTETGRRLSRLYAGLPYNLTIDLSILAKTQADAFQIVEQVLPLFTPDFSFSLLIIPEIGLVEQVPVTLSSITPTDNYEGNFEARRVLDWTFSFGMQVYFYGPKKTSGQIHEVTVDIRTIPFDEVLEPPITLATESLDLLQTEDAAGHLVDEQTSNTYLTRGEVATINVALDPEDQEPTQDPTVKETITEYE